MKKLFLTLTGFIIASLNFNAYGSSFGYEQRKSYLDRQRQEQPDPDEAYTPGTSSSGYASRLRLARLRMRHQAAAEEAGTPAVRISGGGLPEAIVHGRDNLVIGEPIIGGPAVAAPAAHRAAVPVASPVPAARAYEPAVAAPAAPGGPAFPVPAAAAQEAPPAYEVPTPEEVLMAALEKLNKESAQNVPAKASADAKAMADREKEKSAQSNTALELNELLSKIIQTTDVTKFIEYLHWKIAEIALSAFRFEFDSYLKTPEALAIKHQLLQTGALVRTINNLEKLPDFIRYYGALIKILGKHSGSPELIMPLRHVAHLLEEMSGKAPREEAKQ